MIGTDDHEASILASSTSIGLQRERVESSDCTQQFTQIIEHFLINTIHKNVVKKPKLVSKYTHKEIWWEIQSGSKRKNNISIPDNLVSVQ